MLQKPTVPSWPVRVNETVVLSTEGFVVRVRFVIWERLMFPLKVQLIVFGVGSADGRQVGCSEFVELGVGEHVGDMSMGVGVGVLVAVGTPPKA